MTEPNIDGPNQDERLMAALAYIGSFICFIPTIILFLVKKDESPYIKKHSLQCLALAVVMIVLSIVLTVISTIIQIIPVLGAIVAGILGLAFTLVGLGVSIYVLYLAFQAYNGSETRIPYVTDWVEGHM